MDVRTEIPPIHGEVKLSIPYSVYFTENLFSLENRLLLQALQPRPAGGPSDTHPVKPIRVLFVIDGEVEKHSPVQDQVEEFCRYHRTYLQLVASPIVLPGGEQVKNDAASVTRLQRAVNESGLDRHSYMVVIGGGAVLDSAGFAAATSHRGIRLIRIPTTTLSQDDSGVGVKNGINAFGKKNFVGTFAPPWAVINDFKFLLTLPDREWRNGIAEAVKVALIKDTAFFDYLESAASDLTRRDMQAMKRMIHRSAELHVDHICRGGDPFEMGSSRPLDFGHWAAHKLEQTTNYRLRHGEAVAVGLALDVTYSYLMGFLSEAERARVLRLLSVIGFELYVPELGESLDDTTAERCVLQGLREFREHLGGELTVQMLQGIGRGFNVHEIDEDVMRSSIRRLKHDAQDSRSQSEAFNPEKKPSLQLV